MNEISIYLVSLSILSFALLQPSALAHSHALIHDHNDDPRNLVGFNLTRSICGAHDPSSESINQANEVVQKWRLRLGRTSRKNNVPFDIPLAFHVITSGAYGHVDASDITKQMNVLNEAYAPEFKFTLIDTTYTENHGWFTDKRSEMDMYSALKQGGCETLNVYTTNGYGYLGFANFPNSCASVTDGAVINYDTLPDGPLMNFDGGDTLTHEVGHWLGLFHTFQGDNDIDGCYSEGDGVDDTPPHKRNFSCDPGQNTCDSTKDLDPLSNFMNYTPDYCMQSFTPGQFERMIWSYKEYREVDQTVDTLSPALPPTPLPTPTEKLVTIPPTPAPQQKEITLTPSHPVKVGNPLQVGCSNPKHIHFKAKIQTGGCGNDIRFILQKKKKKKKGKKTWKKMSNMDGSNDVRIMKVERCVPKKFCYRYKLNDLSSKTKCVNQGNVVVTATVDGEPIEDDSKRKAKATTFMFGNGCGKKKI